MVELLDFRCGTFGCASLPPASSDHSPILVHLGKKPAEDGSNFFKTLKHEIASHVNPEAPWHLRYHRLLEVPQCAVAWIQHAVCHQPPPCWPSLSTCWSYPPCPCLFNGHAIDRLLPRCLPRLSVASAEPHIFRQVLEAIPPLRDEAYRLDLAEQRAQAAHEIVPFQRSQFNTMAYSLWRRARLVTPPLILDDLGYPDRDPAHEAMLLRDHWASRFDIIDVAVDEGLNTLVPHVPQLPWTAHNFGLELTRDFLKEAPSSAPGPDELHYRMFKGLEGFLAQLHVTCLRTSWRQAPWPRSS